MTKEQEKAIEGLKSLSPSESDIEIVLNMLKEKDEQIAKYEKIYKEYDCYRWVKELEKKDKQIDLMAEYIDGDDTSLANYLYRKNGKCNKKMIKQYFERKVKNGN